jgi:nucleoid-associated protein EbfC
MEAGDFDLAELMKKAQQMRAQADQLQEKLSRTVVEASAGGGMVTARVNGEMALVGLRIDPSVVDSKDIDMLQDLVIAACAAAQRKAREAAGEEISKIAGQFGIPGTAEG